MKQLLPKFIVSDKSLATRQVSGMCLKSIYEHKFVFAPRGRGIDTHRMWESLYLRTIPIVRKTTAMKDFYDLPILFIDNWDDITEEYLEIKYQEIINKKYNIEKINVNYWINRIKEYSHI